MRSLRTTVFACTLLALFSAPAFSSVVPYVDYTSWFNQTDPAMSIINFDTLAPNPGSKIVYADTTGLVLDNITFQNSYGNDQGLSVDNETGMGNFYDFHTGAILVDKSADNDLRLILPANITAVGFDIFSYSPVTSQTYSISINGSGFVFSSTADKGSDGRNGFFGFTGLPGTIMTTIDLETTGGNGMFLDNFRYGTTLTAPPPVDPPTDTPEVCTWIMIASGLIFFAKWRRRQKLTAAAVQAAFV